MNEKEISEIRRRFRVDKSNITRIRGCYVNEKKEIISKFDQSVALLSAEECEKVFGIMKRTLSGTVDRNLIDISFTNNQVLDSDEHRLLTKLKDSSLSDDNAFEAFINTAVESLAFEGSYVIILACDKYDVPAYTSDGVKKDDPSEVYSYILCSICPVKMTKPSLGYRTNENRFCSLTPDWVVSSPSLGFLFPAFDGRRTNIYDLLFYTRDIADSHGEFISSVFKSTAPMPAAEQKQSFDSVLRESVAEECSYDVVKNVHDRLCEIIEEHKASKDPDPPVISKNTVRDVLESCGVKDEHIDSFSEKFDETFGKNAELAPRNIIDTKQFSVKTPDISIKMTAEGANLFETRVIDGQKYILIHADGIVEVNGVEISINDGE